MPAARLQRQAATDASQTRAELLEIVRTRSFRLGRFTLASGMESDLYFNMKPTMMDPRGGYLAARAMLDAVIEEGAEFIGGLALGAVPTLGAVAAIGYCEERPVRTFFVRQKTKDHGTKDLIEGLAPGESLQGKRVVVVDDVATTGGSILQAIDAARAGGAIVETGVVIVDRQEGAEEFLRDRGIVLKSLFKAHQFA